jgi:hypothetical protein
LSGGIPLRNEDLNIASWCWSRVQQALVIAIAASLVALHLMACGTRKSTSATPVPSPAAESAPLSGPEAKIHVSYARHGDFLNSLLVTKYSSAENVTTLTGKSGQTESIIRFEGGVPVWQIDVDKSLLSDVPVLGGDNAYALTEIKYGRLPARFVQSIPDGDPPEPLEIDHYYIFAVTRASGSISYEAVKVDGDGSLETYEAEPRAGTSFRLCCNVGADFTVTTTPHSDAGNGP